MRGTVTNYKYLAPDPDSTYTQLRIRGRRIFARTLYSLTVGDQGRMTPEEVAADYELPLEAVLEAIAYCQSKPPEIAEDWAADEARATKNGIAAPFNSERNSSDGHSSTGSV